jgi:hypothetical protein
MKPLTFALCVVFAFDGLSEQKPVWQPAPGHTEIAIWPEAAPDPQAVAGPEYAETSGKDFLPGGRPAVGSRSPFLYRTSIPNVAVQPMRCPFWPAQGGML